ncbi:hypothetical protein GCM10008904_32870 [Paraclostridium ghonii]|uniref:Leucine-rich repeat (LRR) protein n=1 Tax=Paraclostridium ghonii TaxID=29358 RepID=A0ABU0N4D0_9FIRM|nr:immunoglobulin-like domain-containing protein [Paeniclostridium ghonii]MDQ0557985.1 Leucine-rich repeat (LRR) protein [Paeniclostridium ghonii]
MHKKRQYIMKKIVVSTIVTTMMLQWTPINVLANEGPSENLGNEITTNIDNKSKEKKIKNSSSTTTGKAKNIETVSKPKSTNIIVTIPDVNLKKAINKELGQDEDAPITNEQLKSLKSLNLGHLSIENLEGIQYCTNLLYLNLYGNEISDISYLQHLTNLFTLNLDSNIVQDLTPLQNLYNLSELSLSHNDISDLTPLKGLSKLQSLNLASNNISDLRGLEDLTSLAYLTLSDNYISDLNALENLTNLTSLYLGNNNINNITPLNHLDKLYYLSLSNNKVINISPLENLIDLSFLHLSYNNISDISSLKNLTNLSYLHLNNNKVSEITALHDLTNLTSLYLGNNDIRDISALNSLTNLSTLNLSYNKIDNVISLHNLENLAFLNLNGNSISDLSPLSGLNNLSELSAIDQKIVLDSIKIDKTPVKIKNYVINIDETVIDISNNDISSGGSYDLSTTTVQWSSVNGDLKYSFKYSPTISSYKMPESFRFNGTVIQPYEYVANQINKIPEIKAEDKVIKIGYKFNPLQGVTAHDKEDGNITKNIKVIENTVNPNKVGKYKVTYQVTDSKGALANKTISVIVKSNDKPVISGADDISIVEGYNLNPLKGVMAIDTEDGDLTNHIKVIGSVNINKPGRYNLIYTVTDSDKNTTNVKRTVIVSPKSFEMNNRPVINAYDKVINVGDKFDPLAGVKANDKEDGNITNNIKVIENTVNPNTVGTYIVRYQVTDSKGATTNKTIFVSVKSNDKPIIHGTNNMNIKKETTFDPIKGVTATDTEDGNITKNIKTSGSVDTNNQGKYELIYTVTDSDGNTTTAKRIITIDSKIDEKNNIPVINAYNQVINVGDKFDPLAGVSARDKKDGDITKNIKVVENTVDVNIPGTYKVTYQVSNSKGTTTKAIYVTVNSKEFLINAIPEIKSVDKVINVGDTFDALAEVKANDKEDGNITKNIKVVENTVDVNKPGTYKVTYQVIDSQGCNTTKTINISVIKNIDSKPRNSSDINTKNIIDSINPPTGDMSIIVYIILGAISLVGLFIIKNKMK